MPQSLLYSALKAAVGFLSLLVCFLTFVILYRLWCHPLSRVPGPKLAGISNVWYAYHARNGRMLQLGKKLHNVYGPVVRVGPNEVWFIGREAFSKIYSATQGYEKSDFYLATALHRPKLNWSLGLSFPDSLDLLSERHMDRYRLQRRLIGPTYQIHNILRYEAAVDEVLNRVIVQLEKLNGTEVDLKEWMHIITVECLAAIVLSWSPGYLQARSDGGSSGHAYLGWRRKSVLGLFPWAVVAESYSKSFGRAFSTLWKVTFKTPKGFKPFFPPVYTKAMRRISAALRPKPPKDVRKDLVADLIQLHKDKPEFKDAYLKRMIITNFGAGHETTSSTLISALAMIGSRGNVQRRVSTEVRQAASQEGPICFEDAVKLRYTQAAIKEAQRLYPVLGMSPSRKVPEGGLDVYGYYFPPGTKVGCNPVSLHRNADVFGPDAEDFIPERWLDRGDTKDMERYNLIWGGGARTCPGRNLAQLIVYKVVPSLLKEFDLKVKMPPEDEIQYYFMAMLTGVKVQFLPKEKTL